MISTFTAFFDSNIFFGVHLRSLIVELAQTGLFRARWSDDVHKEWIKAVTAKRPDIDPQALSRVRSLMDAAVPGCLVAGYEGLVAALKLPDPDDRPILAAAIRAKASVIVTFNEKDFPPSELEQYDVHTRHPDDFILDLADIDEREFLNAACQDWRHYCRPAVSLDDYLQSLVRAGIPKTAAYLEDLRVLIERT